MCRINDWRQYILEFTCKVTFKILSSTFNSEIDNSLHSLLYSIFTNLQNHNYKSINKQRSKMLFKKASLWISNSRNRIEAINKYLTTIGWKAIWKRSFFIDLILEKLCSSSIIKQLSRSFTTFILSKTYLWSCKKHESNFSSHV